MHLSTLHCSGGYLKWLILLTISSILFCLQFDVIDSKIFHHKQSGILRNKCGFMEFKCPSKIYNSGPCYKGVVRKKIIVFKRTPDCICLPFVYNMLKKCPCGPPSKVLYTCSNQKQVEGYVYEKRINGICEKFPLKIKSTENCTINYAWGKGQLNLKRKKRSVHLDTSSGSKCGKNQHFVVDRNPCPETCEGKFFGVESKCSYISSGPGCQCRPGYMRDGSLCVRPSQCGCLDSVCIDREPTEKCKLWKAEGRCLKDQAIMHRVCRATCQQCERPCEDQIATSQCELIKKRGECQIDFYKSICMLTCSPHNCRCPKCHIEGGPCNPVTKNIELRHICYRLQSNGTCKPLITRRYRPCGECPTLVMRIPEKCNFCKGFRTVRLRSHIREERGLRRCLMVERTHKERCSCKTISLAVKTCRDNNIPVVKTMVRVQTSCDKCMYRKINALGKRVECKKHWIKRGKCERTHLGQIGLTRKVIYARQITKNCKCQLISREEREICGCPLPKRSNPICIADKDQLAVKTTYYKPNKTHCVEYTNVSWIPKIPCPPANGKSMVGKSGQFYCNLNTCERKWTGSVWIREKCKCKSIEVTHHAGKCCCPKPEYTQSDCQNGLSDVTHINYSLVNGNCQRHIFRFTIRCNCPNSKSSVHCDAESGIKTMKTIKYEMKKDGTCKQIEIIESHRINCLDDQIKRISECRIKQKEDNRLYRQLLVTQSNIQQCACTPPKPKIYLEACDCPEAHTTLVKQIQKCPSWCYNLTTENCDHRCQDIFIWRKLAYDLKNPGHCRAEILKKTTKPCCCKHSKQARNLCSKDGERMIKEIENNILKDGQCTRKVQRIEKPVHCKLGLLKEKLMNPRSDGTRLIQSIYGYRDKCQCKIRIEEKLCNQSCPKSVYKVECDPGSRELVHKQIDYVNVGCSCETRIYKRRTKVFCPKYSNLISSLCSPITKIETRMYKVHFQKGCECKENVTVKTRRCGCPKDHFSDKRCDTTNNKLVSIRTHYELLDSACLPQKSLVEEPINCDTYTMKELRQNNGRKFKKLTCDEATGRAQLITYVWVPKNCECTRVKRILREGLCKCPKTHTLMHCDSETNAWVRRIITYRLDKENLMCQKHETHRSQPTFCPPSAIQWRPCDIQRGSRQLILTYYRRSHCHCIKQKQILSKPCGCQSGNPQITRKCDPIQGILQTITHKYQWNDKSNECVKVDVVKTMPVVCRIQPHIVRGKCVNGKLKETVIHNIPDANNCTCRKQIRTYERDCRCSTEFIRIGNCSLTRAYWKEILLEQQWDDRQQKCMIKKSVKTKRYCRCPPKRVNTACDNGYVVRTEISFKLNKLRAICQQIVSQSRFKPVCKETDGLRKSKKYQSLFYRHLQTKCDRSTCTRGLETYANEYNPRTCKCGWKLVSKKRCTCCGCPKPSLSYTCENERFLIVDITYYTTKQHRCGHECMRRVRTVKHKMSCGNYPPPSQSYWSQCDRTTCQQSFISPVYKVKNCRCILTPKVIDKRTCCCLKGEEKETFCRNGQLDVYTHRTHLQNWQCVRSTKKETVPIVCSKAVKIKYGECRPQTCRRPVFLIKSVADPNNCKCRQHQIVKEERECCCLRRSHQRLLCVGNCKVVIQQKYKFDAVNERCVKENFIRRKCPKCPSPNVLEGTCDTTGTCLKPIRHINYVIKGCQCQSVEQIRHVRCCCPAPRQLGSKCLADKGIIQNKNIYYELEKDRCIKRVKIEEKQVICPQNIEKNLSGENQFCDPNSCLQIVTTFKWSRIGCKCIKQLLTVPQVCCCTNRIAQSKKNCLPNGTIRLTIQNWKFNNGQCIKVNTVKDLPPPLCKPQEVTSLGPCDKTSGMQPILVTRSVIEECECKLVYREKRDRICACEAPTIHVKPCDRITCLQQTTTIKWALEAKDNKCHRLHPEIKMRPCCCRREIAKDSIFKKCIPTSGKTEITNRTYHFNMKREICEFKDQKKYTDLSCPTEANVIKGACNLANGIALDSITSWEKITSQCKCVQRTKYQKRICSCKHLDKTMKNPICSELHGMLVRKKTAHTLENGICLPKVIWLKKVVVCSSHKNVDKKCDPVTCNQLTTISWFDRKECKCVKKVQFIQGKCCCPKPVEYRECHQNGSLLIIKKVTYNLDEEKGICINQTDQIRKDVVCSVHGPRFIKRICDRQTCHPITILLKTVLKNCQCQRMIRKIAHPDIQCCCSEPRFQEKCDENYGIISRVTYRYELFKRQCITRKFVDQNKVACPEEKVTRGQCDVITKLRPVQRRFHTIVGCKCQVKIESKMEPCTCPLPVLVKENCTAGRISSRVWRLSYSLKRNEGSNKVACEQEKEYLFKEPCHCRPPKISKRCVGDNIIYMKQAEHLINRNDRKFCAIRHFMKKVPVTCRVNAVRVKEEQCENDLKRVTFMHETLDKKTCECKSQVKIEYEKCGCEKDNRVTESCQNGVRVTNKEIVVFSQSLGRCVKSNVRSVHPVVCATKHQVIKSSGCAIERQDGIYQSEEIRWEQVLNCKCVVKRRQILRLCACPKPSIEKQCLDTVNLVVYKNTFMHIGGQCLPNQEVVTTETRCQEKAQIVERSTCEKQPMDKSDITRPVCLETLKISVPTIVNCKCKPKIIQIQRRCCTSEPKVKQICDSVRGRWVKVIEKYVLAPGSILFKRDDLVVYDQIQKVTSEQQDQTVVCPQSVSYENCDRKTGLLTKVKTHYKRIGCECKPVKEITRGRCGCPPKRQWISECKQDFRYRRTILFKQINGTCVRQEKIGKQRCDCPKPIDRVYCDGNGRWVKCTTQYVYNSKTHVCRLLKHCVRWHDECPRPTNRIASPCNLQTQFKHLIQHVQFVKNRTSCKCDAVVKNQWMEYCKCDQLNRKVHHCRNHNTRTVGYLKYSLVKGDCVPKRMKYSQQLNCPKPTKQDFPCDSNPKSPNGGYKISKIQYFRAQNCSCVPREKVVRKICNCSLIHPQVVSKRCDNNNRLLMRRRFSTLVKDKCLHSEVVYRKPIHCKPLRRINVGKCQTGPDFVGTQKIDELQLTVVNCQCVWRIKNSEKKICKCPDPVKETKCINNGRHLIQITTTFNLVGEKCISSQQQVKIDPCSHIRRDFNHRPQFQIIKCDPISCKAKRLDYRFKVRNCQCQVLQKMTDEICCCPKPVVNQSVCDRERNVITQKQIHYSFITPTYNTAPFKSYCQPKYSHTAIKVKCGQKLQRIRVKPCDGEFHHITIVKPIVENCVCKQKILQNLKIRCGCPTAVRRIPGPCINGWAVHKWMGLKSVVTGIVNPYQVAEKSCSPVVLEERRIRCACPSVQVFKKCIKHNFLAVQRIHYKLDRKLNNCKMYKTKELKKLTCSKPQLIQTPCGSKLENYEQSEVTKLWYADQCKCLLKVIKKKWVCNCQARYPKQVIKKCLPNGNQILTLTTIWHNEGRKCVNRTEKQLDDIKCPMNLKIVKGKCDRSKTGRLPLTYLQQRPKHCQCVWQRLKDVEVKNLKLKSSEACRCHRNFMVKRCQSADGNKPAYLVRMYFKYLIQQGECHIYRKTEKKPVVCKLGSQIKKSKCNPITNEHVESRIDTYLDGCQCHRKLVKRRCQCNCPKPKNNSVCQSRDGLLRRIKVVHEFGEDQCTCKAKYYVQSSRVQCNEPPKLIKIGKCHKLPQNESEYMQKNDLYRNVFWSQLHRVGCQCQHKRYMEQIPCYCSPDVKEEKYCIADKIIEIRKTERKLSEDKKRCIRVVISKVRHPIYLEKPIYDKRCNLKTGIETIIQKLPLVENCKRRYRVNVRHRKCKCKTQPRLIRQSNCSPSCKVQYMWIMERSTSDGKCKYYYRVRQRDCCCPPETNLGTFCNRSNGVLDTGYRNFNLINGRCVPKDRFVGKQIVCKRNERIVRHQQPNGWVRIEKQFYVRDGCSCVQKLAVDYDKWNCPPPVMKRRCIQASNEQFILETISTKWELSDSKPICSRLDTVIDRVPIDCSEEYVNKSDKCAFNLGRHALVRIDQVTSFYADGCRCIENNVRQVFTVCKCLRPHQEKSCLHSEGVLIHQNVHYEVSGDKSRCIPRRTRNIFKVTCSPVGPQYKGRTQCDPKTGNFYHLYEESKRVGCQCVKSELRVPARCKCPEPYTQIRCSTNNVQQLNTTTYKLSSKGTCIKSERLHYKFIKCQIPEEILQESPNYEVVQNEYSVRHLHKCGSAGKCSRIIREYKVHTNQRCNCIVQKQQYKEACCCPTEQDLNQFYPGTNSSQPMLFSKQCDADKGLILSNTIKWNLEHGQCWPVVYKTIQPIVCDGKEFLRPVSFCRAGQQKHIHQREIRKGCGCKANKRVVTIPCSCDPLGSTDVVFLVDESMESKQVDYSQYVHKIIKHTVNIFYESSQSANLDELFRFCIVKYSLKTKIVSGLKSYSELYELYAEIKKLTLNNGQQSDLKLALRFLMSRIIPQTRPGASLIIYIITDGARNQLPAAKKLSDYLKTHNVQINVLLLISDRVYDVQFFKQLVSPPSAIHLVELKRNSDQLSRNLSRIADTICKKSCPLNYKKETSCSYGTNCVGRTYTFMYRFDSVKGHCVGKTIVKRKRCCCMQVVQRKRICENNHLIHYTTNWQLTSKGFCKQYITRRDVTGLAISQCMPGNQTFIKTCNARGEAVQVTVHRYLRNCKCETKQSDKIVRCRCTKKYNTKTCFGDDVIVHHYHYERLVEGECLSQRRDVHKKLACKQPKVFKAACDSLTCQQRVTVVTYVAQRCKCKRFTKVEHQTCCCKGNRTSSYAGCKHNDLKVFEEKIVDPQLNNGSCVQRVRYYFQPITCSIKPSVTRHSCRRFDPEAVQKMNYEIDQVDPALIYRLVERVEWKIRDCECRRHYGSYFEACGCDESLVLNDSVKVKQKCDPQSGVILTYKQKVRLEIVGVPVEYIRLNRLNKLSDASCRTHYIMESARKIICPDTKTSIGPCELADNGRSYRTIRVHKWRQHNCVCQDLAPEVVEQQVCACLPVRIQKQCVALKPNGPMNRLQIRFIREQLQKTKLPSGKYKYECKVEQKVKEDIIQCPKNILHYSACKQGRMIVTVKVYKINNCRCQESIRRSQIKCKVPAKLKNVAQNTSKLLNHILSTRRYILDCTDLLPTEECIKMSQSPRRICAKSSHLSDSLCRRTCRRCLACKLDNIDYQMITTNYPCMDNKQGVLSRFLIKSIAVEFTLASCKLACAKRTDCLSFTYSIPNRLDLDKGYTAAKCMLYRVDPAAIRQQHDFQQQQQSDISQQPVQSLNPFLSLGNIRKCLTFRKMCKNTCSKPQIKEISKCECKVYKSYYGYPSDPSKFKTALHCAKHISTEYHIQLKSGICQKQVWQGYTPCSNPRYRDLHIRDQSNCDDINSSLWCEAQLAGDRRKCKDDVFGRVCSKTCGLCTCNAVNIFKGKCNSTGYRVDTHIIHKSHPIHRICTIDVKNYLIVCEYCPVGTYEFVHKCDKQSRSRIINQITAKLIQIPQNVGGKPQTKCSVQTKNYKFQCGDCLAAYRDKYSISPCNRVPTRPSLFQLTFTTEYVISEGGCCKTRRTQRQFNCSNCPPYRVKRSSCYNGQRLKHIIFFTRPWVSSSVKPNECIQRIITRWEKCTVVHHPSGDGCHDILTRMDCVVMKQSGKCHLNSYEARNLCAKTCDFCK